MLAQVAAADVANALGGFVSRVDRASITGGSAQFLAAVFRLAVRQGDRGLVVPPAHGRWLAERLSVDTPMKAVTCPWA